MADVSPLLARVEGLAQEELEKLDKKISELAQTERLSLEKELAKVEHSEVLATIEKWLGLSDHVAADGEDKEPEAPVDEKTAKSDDNTGDAGKAAPDTSSAKKAPKEPSTGTGTGGASS